jgi:hypothetical protein
LQADTHECTITYTDQSGANQACAENGTLIKGSQISVATYSPPNSGSLFSGSWDCFSIASQLPSPPPSIGFLTGIPCRPLPAAVYDYFSTVATVIGVGFIRFSTPLADDIRA